MSQITIRTVPRPNCFLCHNEGVLVHSDLPDLMWAVPGTWNLRQCSDASCRLLWLDPMPVPEDVGLAYQHYWTHGGEGDRNAVGGFARTIYRIVTAIPDAVSGLRREEMRLADMYLGGVAPGRLLDVGCGDATFLDRMRSKGWQVSGVEFDSKAVQNARSRYAIEVHLGSLAEQRFPEGHFDAVTMNHVIEHVIDPVALLAEAKRILKPAGRLVVTTPNSRGLGYKWFQSHWFGLDPPRHLHVFSSASLEEVARQAACTPSKVSTSAGRAEAFLAGSIKVRASDSRLNAKHAGDRSLVLRSIRTFFLRHYEQVSLGRDPSCGEEAVLVFQK